MSLVSVAGGWMRHRICQVLVGILLYILLADFLPLPVHRALYGCSVLIKDLLLWMLPLTVGFFIAHTISRFERKAPTFVFLLLIVEGVSNLICVWYSFLGGHIAADFLPPLKAVPSTAAFTPLFTLPLAKPAWWSVNGGLMFGLLFGCITALYPKPMLRVVVEGGKEAAQWLLTHIISKLIPLFVLGYVARMYQTHLLQHVAGQYGMFVVWLCGILAVYIAALFFLSAGGSVRGALRSLKNMLPAGGLAFTSGCSLSTMPWTIEGCSKNVRTPAFARAVIPATTNIQQVGDCITNGFLCFLIYKHVYSCTPDLFTWLNFSIVFVLTRYATAAIIGGAIFLMLPIYETYLSFSPEMIAIILAFNVILDPLITATNVIANGAMCRIFERIWDRVVTVQDQQQ